jgi:hypothetical protein
VNFINMTHKPIITLAASTLLLSCMAIRAGERDSLRAFHTRTNPSPVGDIGKYEELVVALGESNQQRRPKAPATRAAA